MFVILYLQNNRLRKQTGILKEMFSDIYPRCTDTGKKGGKCNEKKSLGNIDGSGSDGSGTNRLR